MVTIPVDWVVWFVVGVISLFGLTGILAPRVFARIAAAGSIWIDTDRLWRKMEEPVDIDRFAIKHSRLFGLFVLLGASLLGYVYLAVV
ncbi:MAG: hypothetical protein QGG36_28575 [Pirellulaceae bacterium]|nr:hypothetical protein [Pirellulaceae bacterium]MDP7019787.1 hypothetical protein [Pirellulaceae bacterium]